MALIFLASCATTEKQEMLQLGKIDQIGVWDVQVSNLNEKEKFIEDPKVIARVIEILEHPNLEWRPVRLYTAPSGSLRIIFYRNSQLIEAIGIGNNYLVKGTGGDWHTADISPDLSNQLFYLASQLKVQPVDGDQ